MAAAISPLDSVVERLLSPMTSGGARRRFSTGSRAERRRASRDARHCPGSRPLHLRDPILKRKEREADPLKGPRELRHRPSPIIGREKQVQVGIRRGERRRRLGQSVHLNEVEFIALGDRVFLYDFCGAPAWSLPQRGAGLEIVQRDLERPRRDKRRAERQRDHGENDWRARTGGNLLEAMGPFMGA